MLGFACVQIKKQRGATCSSQWQRKNQVSPIECQLLSRMSLMPKSTWLTQNELNSIFAGFCFVLIGDIFFVLMVFCLFSLVLIFVFLWFF